VVSKCHNQFSLWINKKGLEEILRSTNSGGHLCGGVSEAVNEFMGAFGSVVCSL
jgi:hypothetical protein